MSTFRTGTHHGVTIVAEPDDNDWFCCNREDHDHGRGRLVAVVVNGDTVLAERICALLNADEEPDRADPGLDPGVTHICPRCGNGYASEITAYRCCKGAFRAEPAVMCPSCSHPAYMHRERDRPHQPSCIGDGPGYACSCTRTCQGINEQYGGQVSPSPAPQTVPRYTSDGIYLGEHLVPDDPWYMCRTSDPVTDESAFCHDSGRSCPRHGAVTG